MRRASSPLPLEMERRILCVERQAEYLADRTDYIGEQTERVRQSLHDDVSGVRSTLEGVMGRELDSFRSITGEKMADFYNKLQELDKRVRVETDKEIQHVMQYATATTKENETWRENVEKDLQGEFRCLNLSFNEKINDALLKMQDELSFVQERISRNMNETSKREIEEGCERQVEVQSFEIQLDSIRQAQKESSDRLDTLAPQVHINTKTQKRIEQIRKECVAALGRMEKSFIAQNEVASEATKKLGVRMEEQKREIDVVNAMVEHGKMQHEAEIEKIRQGIREQMMQMEISHGKAMTTLHKEHEETISELKQELVAERNERREEIAALRLLANQSNQDLHTMKDSGAKENVLLRKEVDRVRDMVQDKDVMHSNALAALREQVNTHMQSTMQKFTHVALEAEEMNITQSRSLDCIQQELNGERTVRDMEVANLNKLMNLTCNMDDFVEFRKRSATKEKKCELQIDDLNEKFDDVNSRVESALLSAEEAARDSTHFRCHFDKHVSECDSRKIKIDLASLESKLRKSPLMERILEPPARTATPPRFLSSTRTTNRSTSSIVTPKAKSVKNDFTPPKTYLPMSARRSPSVGHDAAKR